MMSYYEKYKIIKIAKKKSFKKKINDYEWKKRFKENYLPQKITS